MRTYITVTLRSVTEQRKISRVIVPCVIVFKGQYFLTDLKQHRHYLSSGSQER
jgi:hypothetical protein